MWPAAVGQDSRLICWKIRLTSSTNCSNFGSCSPARGRTATRPMVSRRRRLSLIASRKRRLIRFRSLAFPSCREIKTPHLNWSAGCQIRVKKSVGNLCPCANSSSISARRFRLTERGSLFFPTNLCRQPFAPLGTPAGQHSAAGLGCHAGAETVIVQLFTVRRLKRSFHYMPASKLALEYSKKVDFVKVLMVLRA